MPERHNKHKSTSHKSSKQCMRCFVSGRVQGVFFRASTRERAQELGLTGFARNLRDGRVEVLACGESTQLDQLQSWLQQGPPSAEVSDVECETLEYKRLNEFKTD